MKANDYARTDKGTAIMAYDMYREARTKLNVDDIPDADWHYLQGKSITSDRIFHHLTGYSSSHFETREELLAQLGLS